MAATGYTTGDPQKVDTSGDTMTGALVLPDSSPAASQEYVAEAIAEVPGGSPATQVVSGTEFSLPSAVGVSSQFARGDHSHGTPDPPDGGGSAHRVTLTRINDTSSTADITTVDWARAFSAVVGTPLLGRIKAAVGDRILVGPNMMYQGSLLLDFVLEDESGNASVYASAEPGTPGTPLLEGNPALYPSTSFSKVFNHVFTVTSESQIDGSGFVAVGLWFKGTGKVFAHTIYPWSLLLQNIGPEPTP